MKSTGAADGADFFDVLVRGLAVGLKVHQVMATQIVKRDPPQLQTIAIYVEKKRRKNYTYPIANTPCEQVIRTRKTFCCRDQLLNHYPTVADKFSYDMQSYFGSPILDGIGQLAGHICLLDHKALPKGNHIETLINLFLPRALLELKRIHKEKIQHKTITGFKTRLKKYKTKISSITQQLQKEKNKREQTEKTASSYQEQYHNIFRASSIGLNDYRSFRRRH